MPCSVLVLLPSHDFDPTKAAVPSLALADAGHQVTFSTPQGQQAKGDPIMVTGKGLWLLAGVLAADKNGKKAYQRLLSLPSFQHPVPWSSLDASQHDALLLPGGHAKSGMRQYLQSEKLQAVTAHFFDHNKPVAAICHGVVLAARSISSKTGKSVLHGLKTTSLLSVQEKMAWWLTWLWLGNCYRTYLDRTVESELKDALACPNKDFLPGSMALGRDTPDNLQSGFTVKDGQYLSARWPGDVHRHTCDFLAMLQ